MKQLLSFAIMIICVFMVNTTFSQNWSDPVLVSNGVAPDLDIDHRTGNVHIVAINGKNVIYTEMDENGELLFQEAVPGINNETGGSIFGASVAVDTSGFPHIAYRDHLGEYRFDLYYIYKSEAGWSSPVKVASNIDRGYSFRIDVDDDNQVHLAHGSAGENVWGPVSYYKFVDGVQVATHTNLEKYRADDRIEIDSRGHNNIHLILGCPDPRGPVTYWRSADGGASIDKVDNVAVNDARGRNGSPDIFVDKTGKVHICYGTSEDDSRSRQASVRYARYIGDTKLLDVVVTPAPFLEDWHHGLGLGSVAASDDGKHVIITFLTTDGGFLYAVSSNDSGVTWSIPQTLCEKEFEGYEGRNKHILRASKNNFHVIYPDEYNQIWHRLYVVPDLLPPNADAGGPYVANEGDVIQFDASNSSDDAGISAYDWDWNGDGSFDLTVSTPIVDHQYQDDYEGVVILKVTDIAGKTNLDTATVIISNVPPVPDSISNQEANEGQELTFQSSATDVGTLDSYEFWWFFGDGDSSSGQIVNHIYADNGNYTVTLKVIDDDGGVGQVQALATIRNVAPTVDAGGPYSSMPNITLTFNGTATDPGVNDSLVYDWDLDADGIYETPGKQVNNIFELPGMYQVKLRVVDKDSGSGIDSASVNIIGKDPIISGLETQIINEGEAFAAINLDDHVYDPDDTDEEITWSVIGNVDLTVLIENRVASIAPVDSEWNGTETLTFVATDPDNNIDSASVAFTVNPVNDPPVTLPIADQTINEGEAFIPFNLDDYVADPDNTPDQMTWSHSGSTDLIVTINSTKTGLIKGNVETVTEASTTRMVSIAIPDSEWSGSETITFVVQDPGELSDSISTKFTVNPVNDAPRISEIPEQIISLGEAFPELNLDDYVFDPDHADSKLSWSYSGNLRLLVSMTEHTVIVSLPSSDWSGKETITFKVVDPESLFDEINVNFIANRNNQPPVIGSISNVAFNEDDTLQIPLSNLQALVSDPDNEPADFQFFLVENNHIFAHQDNDKFNLYAATNWNGLDTVKLVVSDGLAGKDTTDWIITVNPQNDPPGSFKLITPLDTELAGWPVKLNFLWQKAIDPDAAQSVNYILVVSHFEAFSDTIISATTSDTSHSFTAYEFDRGDYYWKIYAFSSNDGLFTLCDNVGHFYYSPTSVQELKEANLPDSYALYQNHPNPFNPETCIGYTLPKNGMVELIIYNTVGQIVRIIDKGFKSAGLHTAIWDGYDELGQMVSSGIYIYQLKADGQVFARKMLLTR